LLKESSLDEDLGCEFEATPCFLSVVLTATIFTLELAPIYRSWTSTNSLRTPAAFGLRLPESLLR
jgi:hypothetical protein